LSIDHNPLEALPDLSGLVSLVELKISWRPGIAKSLKVLPKLIDLNVEDPDVDLETALTELRAARLVVKDAYANEYGDFRITLGKR
jgi:hypothetical protein